MNPDEIVHEHIERGTLFGLAYSNPIEYIKAQTTTLKQPNLLVLGTSRSMQIRSGYFKNPEKFYNAAGAISRIKDFRTFFEKVGYSKTQLIIIGLDQNFFNDKWDNLSRPGKKYKNPFSLNRILRNSTVGEDLVKGKISYKKLLNSTNIGFTAINFSEGFRKDGSYLYNRIISDPESSYDFNFKRTLERIDEKKGRFKHGLKVNESALDELNTFLKICYSKNIKVVGFLPPYAEVCWDKMSSIDGYKYVEQIYPRLVKLFGDYNAEIFDFSAPDFLHGKDGEFIDGFHGSDVTYLRLLIVMAAKGEQLKNYVNLKYLKKRLLERKGNFEVY